MILQRTVYKNLNTPERTAKGCFYGLEELPEWVQQPPWVDNKPLARDPQDRVNGPAWWSNAKPPPPPGTRVHVNFNGFGDGTVVAYFREDGYLGVEVMVDKRPDWHVKRGDDKHPHPMCFGVELTYESV